ncbi:transcription elongation factor GreA [candidate division Kazan bacterium RIFCSPHIGHO2_01_FULL_49_10]|uniref:Transcription elongation factor GreA n=1 Tax=candidate division Kazan bacterium RIFCSPLOWO2_01_FULL_48_13 TaxID=1798539 RepID=A0A1F4PNQ1_UNCK3|nr:MAG: transcription elongation factor GreA [candidate division Kazan bacterium RIFCSPHIGHO2_01_FULL_49_10]OGB85317.1 MAG: transcription elongation factor GreA [candidate division Kazan bacterium RIFCSPLOWO2_01_FULL_48_13]
MTQPDLYISRAGLEELKTELSRLLEERKEITAKIKEAREFGDLSENAEYQEAKTKQSFIEGRIAEIESMLKIAKMIDDNNRTNGRVALGSTVKVQVNGDTKQFVITGSNESNPAEGKISNESPIGRALMGQKKGDQVDVTTPDGTRQYTILEVR